MSKVNIRVKYQQVRRMFLHTPCQLASQREVERLAAMSALALDLDR